MIELRFTISDAERKVLIMKNARIISMLLCLTLLCGAIGCTTGGNPAKSPAPGTADGPVVTEEPTAEPTPETGIDEPLPLESAADFTVSGAFTNNMVLQRGEHIRVWGWAPESENGKKVSGEFLGMFTESEIKDGKWELTFKKKLEAHAEEGIEMRIYTDSKEVVFENVLVGDVFMCMGQSNVAYSMQVHWSYIKSKDEENFGQRMFNKDLPIRLHYNTQSVTTKLKRGTEDVNENVANKSKWLKATSSSVMQFSAIGYMFAYYYVTETNGEIPVGVIEIDGNGQPIGAFVPNEVAEQCKTDTWVESKGYYVTTGVNANWGRFLYNEYMYPFEHYALAGVLWYQGESDFSQDNSAKYVNTFTALMTYMRGTHNLINKDFPVYFIEFPSIYQAPAGATQWAYMDLGKIRAIMGGIVKSLPNSYQGVSCDCWSDRTFWNSLHPNCKAAQAKRAARIAVAVSGSSALTLTDAAGPIIESVTYSNGNKTAEIRFTNVGEGLKTTDGGNEVKGFVGLASKNVLSSKKVTATITGKDTVTLTADFELAGVAYNAKSENFFGSEITLCSSNGNPAGAFLLNR